MWADQLLSWPVTGTPRPTNQAPNCTLSACGLTVNQPKNAPSAEVPPRGAGGMVGESDLAKGQRAPGTSIPSPLPSHPPHCASDSETAHSGVAGVSQKPDLGAGASRRCYELLLLPQVPQDAKSSPDLLRDSAAWCEVTARLRRGKRPRSSHNLLAVRASRRLASHSCSPAKSGRCSRPRRLCDSGGPALSAYPCAVSGSCHRLRTDTLGLDLQTADEERQHGSAPLAGELPLVP